MRRIQKILLGTFLAGVLISGIGTGAAIAEYSSFTYLGERVLGQEKMTTTSLDYTFSPEKGAIQIFPIQYSYYGGDVLEILEDPAVPEGTVRFEITCNPDLAEPFLHFTEFEQENGTGSENMNGIQTEQEAAQQEERQTTAVQGFLDLNWRSYSSFPVWMEAKDQMIVDLKNKSFASYRLEAIGNISIKVNPASREFILFEE